MFLKDKLNSLFPIVQYSVFQCEPKSAGPIQKHAVAALKYEIIDNLANLTVCDILMPCIAL